ncbi:hypothetical protein H112_06062 [Trichophyton rubrum D6]|uniref:Uncharacterized protein n=3 Tax=Trichophyton TaxID=5550 RepID=F2SLZ1_TRIRC|nr:uncharacterized protein TERG_08795 [Trichophyton rubrum CBS 118892]EZF14231.1 hypothetical protein H100_06077 [Trichophyton rubrum MR850]EZF39880.1 hypothetical protein H102_06045 [Trichophyton rubrum CBS 100081]EZF50485.1 hypothetical protein H103_06069 [Trichophyton rubrum CBS 288.86]EZF61200.1 hypothetical protein H104_06058 [Trichophyton rubrum CBS 289.86]EZF71831.1 hypothetical protein H105_06083 [Trichophyton soudanense CBS 452.61]EZF82413.1 hypothetical protein H110_06066 [Trichophy
MPDGYGDWLGETEQERIRGSNGYLEVLQRVTAASSVPLQADLGVSFTIPQGTMIATHNPTCRRVESTRSPASKQRRKTDSSAAPWLRGAGWAGPWTGQGPGGRATTASPALTRGAGWGVGGATQGPARAQLRLAEACLGASSAS